jgi:hypothetical protein
MRFLLLYRLLWRAGEVAAKEGMAEEVTRVHSDMLAPAANAFCQRHDAVGLAENEVAAKRLAEQKLLVAFDPVYRAARWVVLAFVPTAKLPDTLKVQRTDTDVRMAVTTLVSIIESHAGNTWADELMAGRFGTFVPKVNAALNELLAATNALAAARQRRTEAYEPAYRGYVAFKRLVREVCGPSSPEYRRLHPRASVAKQIDPAEVEAADEEAPDSGVMPASKGTSAPPSDSSPVKVA